MAQQPRAPCLRERRPDCLTGWPMAVSPTDTCNTITSRPQEGRDQSRRLFMYLFFSPPLPFARRAGAHLGVLLDYPLLAIMSLTPADSSPCHARDVDLLWLGASASKQASKHLRSPAYAPTPPPTRGRGKGRGALVWLWELLLQCAGGPPAPGAVGWRSRIDGRPPSKPKMRPPPPPKRVEHGIRVELPRTWVERQLRWNTEQKRRRRERERRTVGIDAACTHIWFLSVSLLRRLLLACFGPTVLLAPAAWDKSIAATEPERAIRPK